MDAQKRDKIAGKLMWTHNELSIARQRWHLPMIVKKRLANLQQKDGKCRKYEGK